MQRYWLVAIGFALLFAVLLFEIPSNVRADDGVTPTPASNARGMSSPTDWVARPPDGPSQVQHGAFVYWMRCMVCHGDQGQGLAKFRSSFPPGDQNCSAHGCHNDPRAGAGFTFPDAPPIMGAGTLARFQTAQDLYNFVSTRMPYQVPGTLTQADDWAVVAYLLQKHGVTAANLGAQNAQNIRVQAAPADSLLPVPGIGLLLVCTGGLILFVRRRQRRTRANKFVG